MTGAPLHKYEVRISIGGNTREYVVQAMEEILRSFDEGQNISNSCSGGWDGSHCVTTQYREVDPDEYRRELEEWTASK